MAKGAPACAQCAQHSECTDALLQFTRVRALHLPSIRGQLIEGDISDARRFQADEIFTVRSIVHPVLVAEWDLR